MSDGAIGDLYFHVHHDRLAEFLNEPLANRIAYIKAKKPKREVPIRLRWMTPVQGKGIASLVKARAASDKALAAYDKTGAAYVKTVAAYDKARAAYVKALTAARPALAALHAKEHPNCPWDGRSLFDD